jgi:hypothetical protein
LLSYELRPAAEHNAHYIGVRRALLASSVSSHYAAHASITLRRFSCASPLGLGPGGALFVEFLFSGLAVTY